MTPSVRKSMFFSPSKGENKIEKLFSWKTEFCSQQLKKKTGFRKKTYNFVGSWCARFIYIYLQYRQSTKAGCKEKLLPQPDLIDRIQIPVLFFCPLSLSLSLSLSLNSGEKSPGCLPGLSQPGHALSNFSIYWFIMIHPAFIFKTELGSIGWRKLYAYDSYTNCSSIPESCNF